MPRSVDRLVQTIADGLNEYADFMARDATLVNHVPSSPGFWFYGLAREQSSLMASAEFRKLLSPDAIRYLNQACCKYFKDAADAMEAEMAKYEAHQEQQAGAWWE